VKDEEQLAFRLENDPLAQAAQADNGPAFDGGKRWIDRAQQKRAGQPHRRDAPADDSRLERTKIEQDVRKLGHSERNRSLIVS